MKIYFNIIFILVVFITTISAQSMIPNDWYFGSPSDGFNGISIHKAYSEFLKDKKTKPVVVAVIDSGIDLQHEDLAENLWVNQGEIPNNGIDDDRNGYVDDVHGWNFIGNPNGQNVVHDSYEVTRVYAALKYKYDNAKPEKLNKKNKLEYDVYLKAKETVESERNKAMQSLQQLDFVMDKVMASLDALAAHLGDQQLNTTTLATIEPKGDPQIIMAKNLVSEYLMMAEDISLEDIKSTIAGEIEADRITFEVKLDYGYNIDYDPRTTIVKDNYDDFNQRYYGNNDAEGPDPMHGTHVAGIIGAVRNNGLGPDGIAPNVKLMSVRAVPDGDERDKDVANAIRYAVDNGATVINMSFGKGYGSNKKAVDEAVKYAAKKDVLLVHAAGNSSQNNDVIDSYPNALMEKKTGFLCKKRKRVKNWIEVGAMSYKSGSDAVASFSNYGAIDVDLFAPGVRIYSSVPNDEYQSLQGTSMASPVVAGVAATLRSVYPGLTAEQVKEAIVKSVTVITEDVKIPGSKIDMVSFSKLSSSSGLVNLEKALQYASTMKGKKKVKAVKEIKA
ncbi:MAG: S8 family serine peptidase [Saprospiraceae bacterium]